MGGGGYTMRNVARCWALETAVVLGTEIADELPHNDYFEYYGPDYRLNINPSNMENLNSKEYLDQTIQTLINVLNDIEAVPSVPIDTGSMQTTPAPLKIPEENGDTEMTEQWSSRRVTVHHM